MPDKIVSIIIVNFNAGKFLTDCVRAALQSTVKVKIFISDNGSTDNSIHLLRNELGEHSNLFIKENHENLGFAKGNNIVFPQTEGEYILFLNPDCFLKPDTIERMLLEIEKDPYVAMAGCLVLNPDGTEQIGCRRHFPTPLRSLARVLHLKKLFPQLHLFKDFDLNNQAIPNTPQYVEGISGAFMLVRRKAIEQVGLLDEGYFLHCEDVDWFMRFHLANWKILFVPTVTITHIKGACSKNRPIRILWHKHNGMIRFYRKFFLKRYSYILFVIIYFAIWARFSILVFLSLIHQTKNKVVKPSYVK